MVAWSTLHRWLAKLARPLRRVIAVYSLLLTAFALLRILRVSGIPALDLANTFAPHLFMPLVVTFPLSIIVTRAISSPAERARKRLSGPRKTLSAAGWAGGPRWGALPQVLLIGVGIVWFALPTLHTPVAPPTSETFSAVTFNVQGTNRELRQATDWLLREAPDIIVLQETAAGYDERLAPLYEAYAHEDHFDANVRIFTRHPILRRDILTIEDSPGRYILRLLLDQNGRELAVYAVHLTLPLKPRDANADNEDIGFEALLRYDEARRNAQIRRLLELLEDEDGAFLVAGDFNMSDASLIYEELAGRLHDAWRGAGSGAGRSWPVADAIGLPRVVRPLLRIDYIWHSENLRATLAAVGEPIGSDHLPLRAEFEWR